MADETVPVWAQALVNEFPQLVREVTILNERLPNHIDATERAIAEQGHVNRDHEKRIRTLEQFRWAVLGIASLSGLFGIIVSKVLGL